jgi:L-lactate dehydrogenase
MKVCIVGGGGRVGSCAAFALQCGSVVSDIQILDANAALAEGEALDLLHGAAFASDQRITVGDYADAADSDLFLITAGLRRKPDESRLDLINRNVALFLQICDQIKAAGPRSDAFAVVVSNPVDILTRLAVDRLGLDHRRVIGLGTMLDTTRFRSLIATELGLAPTQVNALILGEHGDSMVPIWSSASVNGLPLAGLPGCSPVFQNAVFERTKGSGAEVIQRKGGAGWAVAIAIRDVIHAIALNQRRLLPVSSLLGGAYGIEDVCLSVPCVVGREGVQDQVELKLWPKELTGLQQSARALRDTLAHCALCMKSLDRKLADIRTNPGSRSFIIADAKDADMAFGVRATGPRSYLSAGGERPARFSPEIWTREEFGYRNLPEFLDIIREVTHQGLVDIVLMSAYVNEQLAIKERLFEESHVTPAARANDTTDVWAIRHGCYTREPAQPFRTATIDHIQCGQIECDRTTDAFLGANLGLYSVTFVNELEQDRETLCWFKEFREEAERKRFRYFLEVFDPNVPTGVSPEKLGEFINDQILRSLAGVTEAGRPLFLKIVYHGPRAMEELVQYDPNMIVGILGGPERSKGRTARATEGMPARPARPIVQAPS